MHIYFSGIGGTGIGPLAEIAQDAGYEISGSDLHESAASLELERRNLDIVYEQSRENIAATHLANPIDWLVYTSALPDNHPELEFARANNIKISKRDEFLVDFIAKHNLKLLAIAGTHGKTTTTAMLVWVLEQLNIPVSYSIGTTIPFGPTGKFDPDAKYFVYECDEYDRNFLKFHPEIAIIPSVDYDHADIYPTVADYKTAFNKFIDQSEQTIMYRDNFVYLTPSEKNNLIILESQDNPQIKLAGKMRRQDAELVAETVAQISDVPRDEIYQILARFPGTNRRFEEIAPNLYSDYAHHPSEIRATLQMAHEINPNVVAIYQPHQNMRQIELADQYSDAFCDASQVYWLPTYMPAGDREHADKILTPADLIAKLSNPSIAEPAELNDDLWDAILAHISAGDLVILLSAGDADMWLREKASEC